MAQYGCLFHNTVQTFESIDNSKKGQPKISNALVNCYFPNLLSLSVVHVNSNLESKVWFDLVCK